MIFVGLTALVEICRIGPEIAEWERKPKMVCCVSTFVNTARAEFKNYTAMWRTVTFKFRNKIARKRK
jgi:hypothetical protein